MIGRGDNHCVARWQSRRKLLIAHGAISNNVEPLWIAKEQGIFRKYGIDADLVFIIAGRAMQAMLAGQVPVGLVGGTHVVNANTGGGDFAMILGLENRLDYLFRRQTDHQERRRS